MPSDIYKGSGVKKPSPKPFLLDIESPADSILDAIKKGPMIKGSKL